MKLKLCRNPSEWICDECMRCGDPDCAMECKVGKIWHDNDYAICELCRYGREEVMPVITPKENIGLPGAPLEGAPSCDISVTELVSSSSYLA